MNLMLDLTKPIPSKESAAPITVNAHGITEVDIGELLSNPSGYSKGEGKMACGKCKQEYDSCIGCDSKTEAAEYARKNGWAFTRAWGWICPYCERK